MKLAEKINAYLPITVNFFSFSFWFTNFMMAFEKIQPKISSFVLVSYSLFLTSRTRQLFYISISFFSFLMIF